MFDFKTKVSRNIDSFHCFLTGPSWEHPSKFSHGVGTDFSQMNFPIYQNISTIQRYIPGVSKKYPLLTGNRNETIRYHYSLSGQLNLSIFNLDPHTLHLKIGHQTLEIQACKVKIYSAPETRGFVKGPSHDLLSQACCTGISTLTFSFLH